MQVAEQSAVVRQHVRRLVDSSLLRNSETQRRLLAYLAEKSLEGVADALKEYTVGIEALGKPESYDPRQDPSVRIQTSKLRQKIDDYYRTEGVADSIRVDFPKGGFKLTFREAEDRPAPEAPDRTAERRWRRTATALASALIGCVLLLVYSGVRLRPGSVRAQGRWTAELQEIWGPFLDAKRPLVVCLGTPLFMQIQNVGFFRSGLLNDWQSAAESPAFDAVKKRFSGATIRPMYSFTGVGEASAAFQLARALTPHRPDMVLAKSNALPWEDIANGNAVFLGPPKYVQQLKDIPVTQDLVVDNEAGAIRNLRPRPGEPSSYPDQAGAPDAETHALVSRLPGLHGNGEIFVFASNWTAGTLGAVQYATEPDYARDLLRRVRLASGALPRHYQILVRVKLQNLYPIEISYVTHHVLNTQAGQHVE
jgi:hypothetical protein